MFKLFYQEHSTPIVEKAMKQFYGDKLRERGYCDINPIIGKPFLSKELISNNLKINNSPFSSLFRKKYASNIHEAIFNIDNIYLKMSPDKREAPLDEYEAFSILYYLFSTFSSIKEKETYIDEAIYKYNIEKLDNIIYIEGILYFESQVSVEIISTLNKYVSFLEGIQDEGKHIYYRGHSNVSYKIEPSLFRKTEWLKNEMKMCKNLKIICPSDFNNMNSHLDVLAKMQHYGLPTRLLDITKNPLVALYFACENDSTFAGEVVMFSANDSEIKYPESDTVSILASLSSFDFKDQCKLYKTIENSNHTDEIDRLLHEIQMEKPAFKNRIKRKDLSKCIFVIPTKNNRRIEKQDGAFIICGLLKEIFDKNTQSSVKIKSSFSNMLVKDDNDRRIVCIVTNKKKINQQLKLIGINTTKIYPEIADVAKYIKSNVSELE